MHTALTCGRVRDEDLVSDRFAQRLVERRLIHPGGLGEQRRIHALAGSRGDAEELLGRLREGRDTRQQHVPERRRQLGPAVLAGGDEELLGEERVALGSGVDRVDERRLEVLARDRPQLRPGVSPREARQLDPLDPAGAFELR